MSDAPESEARPASSLRETAVEFVSARMELLALEAREAGHQAARRGVMDGIIAGCAMIAWLAGVAFTVLGSYDAVWIASIALAFIASAANLPIREVSLRTESAVA